MLLLRGKSTYLGCSDFCSHLSTCPAGAFVATGFFIIFNSTWGKDEPQTLRYAMTSKQNIKSTLLLDEKPLKRCQYRLTVLNP